jgi:hypothetical protein
LVKQRLHKRLLRPFERLDLAGELGDALVEVGA